MNAKIRISKDTTINNVAACKEVITALRDKETGLLDCLETETESTYEVTTVKIDPHGHATKTVREVNLRRIGRLEITVRQSSYDIVPVIEVAYLAEGNLCGTAYTAIMAKMNAWAKWSDNWYAWEESNETGTPKTPYASIYIAE